MLKLITSEINVVFNYFLKVQFKFIVVFINFSTDADNSFGLLVLISTVRETKNSLKN